MLHFSPPVDPGDRPVVESRGVWCLGPKPGPRELAPDLELPGFRLSSLRGRRVLLVAWATW